MLIQTDPAAVEGMTETVIAAFNTLVMLFGVGLIGVILACIVVVVAMAAGSEIERHRFKAGLVLVFLPVLLPVLLPGALTAQASPGASDGVPTVEPQFTRIFGSDSLALAGGALSPDGRWIPFSRPDGEGYSNSFLYPTGGGEPVQLTGGTTRTMARSGSRPATGSRSAPTGRGVWRS